MFLKVSPLTNQLFIPIVGACLVAILILWYDSSPVSFNNYSTICTSNYGKPEEFIDCMKPFYNQLNMTRLGMFASVITIVSTIGIFIYQRFKK